MGLGDDKFVGTTTYEFIPSTCYKPLNPLGKFTILLTVAWVWSFFSTTKAKFNVLGIVWQAQKAKPNRLCVFVNIISQG
jgi:hypothetical protein